MASRHFPVLPGVTTGLKMLRSPREIPAMVLALSVGVGLTVVVFSLVYAVLLAPLPYARPDGLVQVWTISGEQDRSRELLEQEWASLAEAPSPFAGIAAYQIKRVFVQRAPDTAPVEVSGALVSTNLFDVLGVTVDRGRPFAADDHGMTDTPPIVVSERLIRSGVVLANIGEVVRLDGAAYRLAGVMSDAFWFPDRQTDFWVPLPAVPPAMSGGTGGAFARSFSAVARLRDGVSRAAAESQASARLAEPGRPAAVGRVRVDSYVAILSAPVRPAILVLQAASGLVLVLVCLNVGWLFAARARRLRPAFATIRALGASPGQVLATHLVSAVCVAALAVPGAVLIAWLFLRFGLTLESGVFSRTAAPAMTWHVLTVAIILTVLASVASWLPGAIAITRAPGRLQDDLRTATRDRRLEGSIMAAQVGLVFAAGAQAVLVALVLLSLTRTNVGLHKTDFVVVSLVSRGTIVDARAQLERYKHLLDRLQRRGIRTAAANIFPLTRFDQSSTFEPRRSREHRRALVRIRVVTPSYFTMTGLHATSGRLLTDADVGSRQVVVTDAFAAAVLKSHQAIGAQAGSRGEWRVIGVVPGMRQFAVNEDAAPEVYILYDDFVATQATAARALQQIQILAEPGPGVATTLRIIGEEAAAAVPDAVVQSASRVQDLIALSLGVNRLVAAGSVTFAAVALLLAALGLYAMVSHGLELRRREFGVRIALGATTRRLALEAMRPIAMVYGVGVSLGLVLLLSVHSAIRAVMVPPPGTGYPPLPVVMGTAALLLLAVLMIACYRPIRSAAQADPVASLRAE